MFVEKWMTPNPLTIQPEATISFVAMEMNRRKFRHFPVVELTGVAKRLVGIVSKYDIARGFPHDLNPFSVEVIEDSVPRPVCFGHDQEGHHNYSRLSRGGGRSNSP